MSPNPKTLVLLSVVLLGGVLGGTAAYRVVVPASDAESGPRQTLVVDSADRGAAAGAAQQAAARGKRRPAFAPCRKPARLEGGTCVIDEVRTVTLPGRGSGAAAAPPAPAPAAPSSGGTSSQHSGDDDHGHHGGDDDHDDDEHNDDDHSGHGHGGDDDHDDD